MLRNQFVEKEEVKLRVKNADRQQKNLAKVKKESRKRLSGTFLPFLERLSSN
jgi:hypothetical protein